jgi:KEOPS complex subunit Pcc1
VERSHEATFICEYDSQAAAQLVSESIARELDEIDDGRARASVTRNRSRLTLTVVAADLVALRAGLNSWTSLIEVAETVGAVATEPGSPNERV